MLQDPIASDSYEHAMTVMQVNPLLKSAMRQLKGIRLEATDEEMVLTLLSRFSWFRVKHGLPLVYQSPSLSDDLMINHHHLNILCLLPRSTC